MNPKHRKARWIGRGLLIGALATGAACSSQSTSSPVPTESTAVSSPVTTTTQTELRTLPYPPTEEDEKKVRVRFVAYGDVDPDDDIPFGVIPDVQIAVITTRESADWWNTIGGDTLGELLSGAQMYIPPGAQIQSTAEDIAASPIDFVTTGSDGTAETYLDPSQYFSVCAVSPVDEIIAGCNLSESVWRIRDGNPIFYIYFSHGHAYIENEQNGSERYHRFLYGDHDSYSPSEEPAVVTFISTAHTGTDVPPFIDYLAPGASVAVIDDADIGAWWAAVSNNETAAPDLGPYSLSVSLDWEFGWGIPYDMEVRKRVVQSVPVRIIDIGWPGIIEVDMAPGDYLLCHVTYEFVADCNYANIAAAQDYIYRVTISDIWQLSDIEGRQLLEEVENWGIRSILADG